MLFSIHSKGVSQLAFLSENTFISGGNDGVIAVWKINRMTTSIMTSSTSKVGEAAATNESSAKKGKRQKSGKNKSASAQRPQQQPETKVTVQTVIELVTRIQHDEAINWISVLRIESKSDGCEGKLHCAGDAESQDDVEAKSKSTDVKSGQNCTKSDSENSDAPIKDSSPPEESLKVVVAVADSSCDIVLYEIDI